MTDDDLYAIPISHLELSEIAVEQLHAADVVSVGDLIDVVCLLRYATVSMPFDMMALMTGEVKQRLQQYGYWYLVEGN